jgi:hypothetical protein
MSTFTPRHLTPVKEAPPTTGYEARWAPEPMWKLWITENLLPPQGMEVQFLGCPAHSSSLYILSSPGSRLSTTCVIYLPFQTKINMKLAELFCNPYPEHQCFGKQNL